MPKDFNSRLLFLELMLSLSKNSEINVYVIYCMQPCMGGLNPHWFLEPLAITEHQAKKLRKSANDWPLPYKNNEKFTRKAY